MKQILVQNGLQQENFDMRENKHFKYKKINLMRRKCAIYIHNLYIYI